MERRQLLKNGAGVFAVTTLAAPRGAVDDASVLKLLDDFAAAWNRHDVDRLMACMTDDCVFESAAGPDVAGTSRQEIGDRREETGDSETSPLPPTSYLLSPTT